MNSRAERYQRLLRQVARELDERPNAEVIKHVATLRLMREDLQIRPLEGERVDPADILKLDEGLKQYLPQGKPLSVKVTFVNGTRVSCPGCKLEFDPHTDKPYEPSPPPTPDAKPVIDAEPVKALPKPPKPEPAKNRDFHAGGPVKQDSQYGANVNPFLGGFSSKTDKFGLPRTPSPAAKMD